MLQNTELVLSLTVEQNQNVKVEVWLDGRVWAHGADPRRRFSGAETSGDRPDGVRF